MPLHLWERNAHHLLIIYFLGFLLPVCGSRLAIDSSSCVCLRLCFCRTTISRLGVLQHCDLEQQYGCQGDNNQCVGDQRCIPYPRQAFPLYVDGTRVTKSTRPGTITGAARVPSQFRLIYDPLRLSHP